MKYAKPLLALIIIFLITLLLVKTKETNSNIKIGYFAPATGAAAVSSEQMINAFKLAHKENPDLDNGRKIELFIEDDACSPKNALSAAKKFVEVNNVNLLVSGVCGGSTIAVAPYAESENLILFTPVAATPKITDLGDNVFRTSGSGYQITKMVASELKKLGFSKVGIIYENAEYSAGWKDSFITSFKDDTHSIVISEGYATGNTDMKTQILKIKAAKPDIILLSPNSTITSNILANQIKDLNVTIPVVGNEYLMFKKVRDNPNAEGFYVSSYKFDLENPSVKKLLESYRAAYGSYPEDEIYVALSYDGYNVIRNIFNQCKSADTPCLKKALYGIQNYAGVSGQISIDKNGDAIRDFVLKKIKDRNLIDTD